MVEAFAELAHRGVAAIAHVGQDRLHRGNRAFADRLRARKDATKVAGFAAQVESLQHGADAIGAFGMVWNGIRRDCCR